MGDYATNQQRTAEYLEKFDRRKVLTRLVDSNSPLLIDVGANYGQTLQEFVDWWPNASVICFEPQEECHESLTALRDRLGPNNITVVPKAAGNKSALKADFYTHDVSSGLSGFNKVNMLSEDSIQISQLEDSTEQLEAYSGQFNHHRVVETERLDVFLRENNISQVDLLKIDTQGFEPEVLEGAGELLSNVKIVITELMFYDYYERSLSFSDIEKFLIPAGFRLFDINHIAKNPMNGRTDWVDVIYVNKQLQVQR